METSWDKLRAVVFALGVHAVALALMFVGLLWQPAPAAADAAGPMIEATLVSSPQQSAAIAKAIASAQKHTEQKVVPQAAQDSVPPPQPAPEPKPQDAPQPPQPAPQAPLPKPDTVNQDEVRRIADQAAQQQLQEQEERRKQAQVDLTNQQKQQQEAENRQRLAQQELDRQKLLADIRKQRADAERLVKLEAQRLKQVQDQRIQLAQNDAPAAPTAPAAPPHPPAGNNGSKQDANAKYLKAINEALNNNWHRANAPENVHCRVIFRQVRPSGEVTDVQFGDCQFEAAARESIEALKGIRLPYVGYESVFAPEVNIDMCYPQEACTK